MSTSQNEMILCHLKESFINDNIAREEYGCRRLAARISDLRNNGHIIRTINRTTINRFGKKCSFAEYKLERAS